MALETKAVWQFGPFHLDPAERLLLRDGSEVRLPPKTFDLLVVMVNGRGRLLEKDELLKRVWPDTFVEESSLSQHVSMLRKALQDGEIGVSYIETIPKSGYRFTAAVREVSGPGGAAVEPADQAPSTVPDKVRRSRWWIMLLATAAIVLVAVAAISRFTGLGWRTSQAVAPSGKVMVVVLPFQNLTGDPGQDFFSDGFTEEMITQLGYLDPTHLGVIARTSAMQYRDTKLGVDAIARELGVQYVVEGSVRRSANRIRISAQLIQVRDQTHLWAQNYDREGRDVLDVQSQVASAIAQQIQLKLTPEASSRFARSMPVDQEAYDAYLQGRYFWNRRDKPSLQKAVQYIEQAVARDPNQPKFYAGLADALAILGSLPDTPIPRPEAMERARSAAMKAISLDESSAEPHASLAFVEMHYDWNWPAAEKEFRRAIELNSSYATAHHWYAYYLMSMGRQEDSLREIRRAQELDPLSLIIQRDVADMLYYARRYDEAIAQCRKTLERDPHFALANFSLYQIYSQKKMPAEMDQALRGMQASGQEGLPIVGPAPGNAIVGRVAKARKELVELQRLEAQGKQLAYSIAVVYASLGDRDQAFHWLEVSYQARDGSLILLKTDPSIDSLRDDRRFAELLRKMNLS
jgi:TolB-like protein/DNA-binding winged helix-turn-helix (wHTH) protein/Tfp pilus assembly protein PilF